MKQVTLRRTATGDTGTFGVLKVDDLTLFSGELPERGNAQGLSCIPAGTYPLAWLDSPKFGRKVYHVQNVPERTVIEIHPANHMGDRTQGLRCELDGCIALGRGVGMVEGQRGIQTSRSAVADFERLMGGEDGLLTITDEYLEAGAPPAQA